MGPDSGGGCRARCGRSARGEDRSWPTIPGGSEDHQTNTAMITFRTIAVGMPNHTADEVSGPFLSAT